MGEKTIHINAQLPGAGWLNLAGTVTMQLPYKSVRELAKKLAEVTDLFALHMKGLPKKGV